jgi:hypothetical protein
MRASVQESSAGPVGLRLPVQRASRPAAAVGRPAATYPDRWERGRHMRHIALARWQRAGTEERRAVGRRLLEARRQRVPMMLSRAAVTVGRVQPCEVCGRAPAHPYAPHPLRTQAPPTWRCARHAWAPIRDYVRPAYQAPLTRNSRDGPQCGSAWSTARRPRGPVRGHGACHV